MAVAYYFVERLTANNDVWVIKFDDEDDPKPTDRNAMNRRLFAIVAV
jgi:hypothetical protein